MKIFWENCFVILNNWLVIRQAGNSPGESSLSTSGESGSSSEDGESGSSSEGTESPSGALGNTAQYKGYEILVPQRSKQLTWNFGPILVNFVLIALLHISSDWWELNQCGSNLSNITWKGRSEKLGRWIWSKNITRAIGIFTYQSLQFQGYQHHRTKTRKTSIRFCATLAFGLKVLAHFSFGLAWCSVPVNKLLVSAGRPQNHNVYAYQICTWFLAGLSTWC